MRWREALAAWLGPAGELASLRRECEQHKAAAEGRWKDVYLMHAGPVSYGRAGFEMVMRSPLSVLIVEHLAAMLDSLGAENWVEVQVTHPEKGPLVLTVQRERGETPGKVIAKLKADLAAALTPDGFNANSPSEASAGKDSA